MVASYYTVAIPKIIIVIPKKYTIPKILYLLKHSFYLKIV